LSWALRFGLQREEAADTVQEVYLALLEHIAGLDEKTPDANFLGWLKTVTRNKVCDHLRAHPVEGEAVGGSWAQRLLAEFPDASAPVGTDADHQAGDDRALDLEALNRGRAAVEDKTWNAFWRVAVDGLPPEEVAAEFGMSVAAVYKAKDRAKPRVRRERDGLSQ